MKAVPVAQPQPRWREIWELVKAPVVIEEPYEVRLAAYHEAVRQFRLANPHFKEISRKDSRL